MAITERFLEFHQENPHVYRVLVRLAREWVQTTGRKKLAIKTLFERARWELAVHTNASDFRLNNNYTAFYARMIMANEPDLAGIFDLRASEADKWLAAKDAAGEAA